MATPNAPSQPICPLGISERTISAWRDDAVSRAEAASLAPHVEGCPACAARLAAFDDLASLLRSERPPEPDERLWQAILAAAGPSPRVRRLPFSGLGPARPVWSPLSALAAVLLLTISFVALFDLHGASTSVHPSPTATPLPTPTLTPAPTATPLPALLPAHPLTWQPVSSPAPASSQPVVFAAGGASAYACFVGSDAQGNSILNIWHTSDRGTNWVPARDVPTDPSVNGCELVVDASDPSVAALAWQMRGSQGDYTGLLTTVDGGVTWQAPSQQSFMEIDQLDSRGGVIYALRETVNSGNGVEWHLWASDDRMRSWRQVDHGLPAAVAGFWLQPDGPGILLVLSNGAPSQLWTSPDDGATWHQLDVPGGLPSYTRARVAIRGNDIVARSLQGQFHICVSNATASIDFVDRLTQQVHRLDVTCSGDGGATWHDRTPLLLTTLQGSSSGANISNLVGITYDDTLLVSGFSALYRLTSGSDRWQSLGALPRSGVIYCRSPGAGILWAIGSFGGTPVDSQNSIFTTSYTS